MNQIAKLSALVALNNAQMTLTTRDLNGNTIDQATGAFTAGEPAMVSVDLSIAKDSLAQIELSLDTYGPEQCSFFMKQKGGKDAKYHKIGTFNEVCEWPGKYFDRKNFTGKLNVRDMPEFRTNAMLTVECGTQDVTLSKATSNWGCSATELDTIANNSLDMPIFNFEPYYQKKGTFKMGASGVGMVALHKMFLQGANPALDFAMAGLDYVTYIQGATELFQAKGLEFEQKTILKAGKKGERTLVQEEKLNDFLLWGAEVTGYSNYRTRILMAALDLFGYYYDSEETSFRGKLNDVQDAVFGWNEDTWQFKQLVSGNVAYREDWYANLRTYFYLYSVLLQTTGVAMEIQADSQWWPVDLVRDIAYIFELVTVGFLEIQM